MLKLLKRETRERLQALVQHPDFAYISVEVSDKKMHHASDKGKPTFYTDVNIHTEGEGALTRLISLVPEISIVESQSNRVEHSDCMSFGEYAKGTLEGAMVSFWSTFRKIPKEKAPTAMGAVEENHEEIIPVNYTTESEVVANA